MQLSKIAVLCVGISLIFATAIATQTPARAGCTIDPVRKVIYLRKYTYQDTPEYHTAFRRFRSVFRDNTERLSFELSSKHTELEHISDLKFEPSDIDATPPPYSFVSIKDALKWWRDRGTDAIGVMHGFIKSSKTINIQSFFFIGDLMGKSIHPTIRADVDLDLQMVVDSHSLITAYAIGLDAQLRGCDPHIIYSVFVSANQIARQLEQNDLLSGDVHKIANDIRLRLEELRSK